MERVRGNELVAAAHVTAAEVLADLPERQAHSLAAGRQAAAVVRALELPRGHLVVAAALLHDLGYARALHRTGYHPVDGALHLIRHDWPDLVVRLVAHHSHSRLLAEPAGVAGHLGVIDEVTGLAADVVAYADLTAGRDGAGSSVVDRIAELRARQVSSPYPELVREQRYRLLEQSAARVEKALSLSAADAGRSA